ncbi:hypothetical protein [Phocaeicola sartorii]|uniref:hypothetical protein n=2 Tax=Phocaeicola sartorii TaxID=671267 RepID=UPI001F574DA6|nr:hypothetical protein [Phocaeicola sartorii]
MTGNKKAILGMLVIMIVSLGVMRGINGDARKEMTGQQWAAISYYCSDSAETTAGKVVSETLAGTFAGAGGTMLLGGIGAATGGAGLAVWGAVVLS